MDFSASMKDLQDIVDQYEKKSAMAPSMAAQSQIGRGLGQIAGAFRPVATQAEIAAGVKPEDRSQELAASISAPMQDAQASNTADAQNLLALYKPKMELAKLMQDYETAQMTSAQKQAASMAAANKAAQDLPYKEAAKKGVEARAEFYKGVGERQQKSLDYSAHKSVLTSLKNDAILKNRLNQSANLVNAVKTVTSAKTVTPQQLRELETAIRSNMGIKGAGGVEERSSTYYNTADWALKRMQQYATGAPTNISQDNEFVKHLKDLVNVELSSIGKTIKPRIDQLKAGYPGVYERNPELKQGLDDTVKSLQDQVQYGNIEPAAVMPGKIEGQTPQNLEELSDEEIDRLYEEGQ